MTDFEQDKCKIEEHILRNYRTVTNFDGDLVLQKCKYEFSREKLVVMRNGQQTGEFCLGPLETTDVWEECSNLETEYILQTIQILGLKC